MRCFQLIFDSLDVVPLLNALATKPALWNVNDLRTAFPGSPHAECDDIWLLFNTIPDDPAAVIDDVAVVPYEGWHALPFAQRLACDLLHRVGGIQLGRVIITRLPPGKTIPEHADQGAPAEFFQRYQVALQSLPGCVFNIGEEVVQFSAGECWWIDNQQPHSVINNSSDDRIVMIVDIRTC